MRAFALIELALCAALFAAGFLVAWARRPPAAAVVRAPAALSGLLLQIIGFCLALFVRRENSGPAVALGAACILAPLSVACAWWAFAHLGRQLRISAELVDRHELVETGPYRLVRHPVYTALILIYIAAGLILSRWPAFLAGLVLVISGTHIRARIEERLLASRFGGRFHAFGRRVPAYIPKYPGAR